MIAKKSLRQRQDDRRGAVVVQVAVMSTVLVGFSALTIDVGAMYAVRAELQRSADAAALAAASRLTNYQAGASESAAVEEALRIVQANPVQAREITLDIQRDIEFGRATWDAQAGKYRFVPGGAFPTAVRVTIRKTRNSPNGPVQLMFANIFGKSTKDLAARAAAMVVPRDIALVIDLSGSMNDDSELQHYDQTEINLWDVWAALPIEKGNNGVGNGIDPPPPGNPPLNDGPGTSPGNPGNRGGAEDPGANPVGPTWGRMYEWGTIAIDEDYDPASDPGLYYLPYKQSWTSNNELRQWYQQVGYSQAEINALLSGSYDYKGLWKYRVAVALGLARWDSGKPGGLWSTLPPGKTKVTKHYRDGDSRVESGELVWLVDYPYESGSWLDYIDNYMNKTWTKMYKANSAFRYRFGLKTFVNYLLERKPRHSQTSDLWRTPEQPLNAVKGAVRYCMELIDSLDTDDQVSLEIYAETASHEMDLTKDYLAVADHLDQMQAAHYDAWTNMGGGIQKAIQELHSDRARDNAAKVMFLMTDGKANVTESGRTGDYYAGPLWALQMAQAAASAGIQIYCISVGSDADRDLMQEIAQIGGGEEFFAAGDVEEYSDQLVEIFGELGSKRPVRLIE